MAVALVLHAAFPVGLLSENGPDSTSAWLALVTEALLSGLFILVTLSPIALLDLRRNRGFRKMTKAMSVFVWSYLMLAWGAFRQTGEFPSEGTLSFLWMSGVQVLEHALDQAPVFTLVAFFSIIVLGVSLPSLAALLEKHARSFTQHSAKIIALLFVTFSTIASFGGHAVSHDNLPIDTPQARTTRGERFEYHRRYHAGPIAALLYQLPSSRLRTSLLDVKAPLAVVRPPLTPLSSWLAQAEPQSRPNVVVVLVESLRADVIGHPESITPHLDELSRRSRVFTNVYTMASHSDAADPCPLSGQGPVRAARGSPSYPKNPLYPRVLIYDILKGLGYRTALISSQNETWGDMINFLDTGGLDYILHSETYDGPTYVPDGDPTFKQFLTGTKKAGKIDDRFTVGEAIRWIEEGGEQPFFIYMNLQNSHVPYRRPADHPARFTLPDDRITASIARLYDDEVAPAKRLYWDALNYVDAQLHRLVEHLEATGQLDDTLLFVTGDTGQAFMEHGYFTHARDIYNEVMHVPLVVWGPGVEPGASGRLGAHIDIPSTILAKLGLPAHPSFHGVDLFDEEPETPRSVFLSVNSFTHQYGIVRDGFKLIHDMRRGRALLFDLTKDPGERLDIAARRPELFSDLLGRVNTHYTETLNYFTSKDRMSKEFPPLFLDP